MVNRLFEKIKGIVGNTISFKAYSFELEKLRIIIEDVTSFDS